MVLPMPPEQPVKMMQSTLSTPALSWGVIYDGSLSLRSMLDEASICA